MKNKITAALLALFLGWMGIHKFYLGEKGKGLLYLLFSWTGIPLIISIINFFVLLFMSDEKFNEKYNKSLSVSKNSLPAEYKDAKFILNGVAEKLIVFENRVVIDRNSTTGAKILSGLAGNKTIPFKAIQSVQYKEATTNWGGFIQFGILGGVESTGGVFSAAGDENSVTFRPSQNQVARQIKEFIESRIYDDGKNATIIQQNISYADELLKFKDLLDKGVISQEEYNKKKAELLK